MAPVGAPAAADGEAAAGGLPLEPEEDAAEAEHARRTFARKESSCALCSSPIAVGAEIWPVAPEACAGEEASAGRPSTPAPFRWCHVACAARRFGCGGRAGLVRPPCPWWSRRGACLHGARCVFQHSLHGKADAPAAPEAKALFSGLGRAGVFRRWLLNEFGVEELAKGTGVLDVAGGKGELSFELLNLNEIPSTVVDPRDLALGEFEEKFRLGRYSSNRWLCDAIGARYWEALREGCGPRAPGHLRMMFDHGLLERLETGPARTDEAGDVAAEPANGETEVTHVLSHCSALLGMHLDGAAEAVVDFALRLTCHA
mmetsp:Transcript_15200/g.47237  ORF Transcript_15200/g.47237 Transcript_15200/m.47237 type:complete len:315 (+) Transcript_15200:38-982(+)